MEPPIQDVNKLANRHVTRYQESVSKTHDDVEKQTYELLTNIRGETMKKGTLVFTAEKSRIRNAI